MKTWQIILGIVLLPTAIVGITLLNKPAALVSQSTDTAKMIQNYEWFYEASNNFNTRVLQVKGFKENLKSETDKSEQSRIRVDLSAVQQSCRELAAKYEAQSGKIHVGYLKSKDLPSTLNAKECE